MAKIDAFAHVLPTGHLRRVERALDRHGERAAIRLYRSWMYEDPVLTDLDARWRLLDDFADYVQVLVPAVPPLEHLGPPGTSRELARELNDELAELVRAHDRFLGFAAALPLDDVEASLAELDRATEHLGALGAQLFTNVQGVPLDDPRFEPLFERLDATGCVAWIHPTRSNAWPDYPTEQESRYGIWWSFGWPYETATAMARLVYSGHMERFAGLKVIAHHAGGLVPHLAGRLTDQQADDQQEALARLKRPVLDYFRRFHADTAMFGAAHAVRCAVEFFGAEHVLFGTDMPLGGPRVIADTIADIEALQLPAGETDMIFSGNARRLLGLA
jgi:predicted TIM-barrel fold metal-dependent hydrolase